MCLYVLFVINCVVLCVSLVCVFVSVCVVV